MQIDGSEARTNGHESTEGVPAHTPLPWTVEGPTLSIVSTCEIKGDRFHVADMRGWGHLTGKGHGALGLEYAVAVKIQEANADLIVRAVNNHGALVKALEDLLATFKSHVDGRDLLDELHPRKTIDIKVRVDARERWHEGDWLSNVRDAVRPARIALAKAKETTP